MWAGAWGMVSLCDRKKQNVHFDPPQALCYLQGIELRLTSSVNLNIGAPRFGASNFVFSLEPVCESTSTLPTTLVRDLVAVELMHAVPASSVC